jgi:hypothetical protein
MEKDIYIKIKSEIEKRGERLGDPGTCHDNSKIGV